MTAPPKTFNRKLYAARRGRAAKTFSDHDFLHRRVMEDIVDRLETVMRDFPRAAFVGAGELTAMLTPECGVGDIISTDSAGERLPSSGLRLVGDDEAVPFASESLNLFVSLLTLHTVNDVVGALVQARMALKPDGLFIAAVFAEETLANLRQSFYQAETELTGGVSARVSPFAGVQDFGQALFRAGFALPVVDIDKVRVRYAQPLKLIGDLRRMGETRVLSAPAAPLRRGVLMRAMEIFTERGGEENFDIVYMTGWAPHESQQKPLAPGSATSSLEEAVKRRR